MVRWGRPGTRSLAVIVVLSVVLLTLELAGSEWALAPAARGAHLDEHGEVHALPPESSWAWNCA